MPPALVDLLAQALTAREALFDGDHETAFRLFNGFSEGQPDLAIDLYARTLVLHNYADEAATGAGLVGEAVSFLQSRLPWLRAGIVKTRNGASTEEKRGQLVFGEKADSKVRNGGAWYALDLTLNRDASLYLDTRNLRAWARATMQGKTVLNTFAYTGSLGVAALAGGAQRVVQLDRNRQFLNIAKTSYSLNGLRYDKRDFLIGDFFSEVSRLKRANGRFDCVLIDPPFFATSARGKVDLVNNSARLINKVRPLINDGGYLVAINNALYVSGKTYMDTLEALCADGYLQIEELIAVPEDFTGYSQTRVGVPVADPAPFNHPTKIAVLRVSRKPE
jgi:23S rRNA (cytosine1962-C5)-methyltransferase